MLAWQPAMTGGDNAWTMTQGGKVRYPVGRQSGGFSCEPRTSCFPKQWYSVGVLADLLEGEWTQVVTVAVNVARKPQVF